MSEPTKKHAHVKLSQWFATAICGNDILSSSLYVSGIAVLFAGVYAPIVLLMIGFVLFLYKKVYTEVVEALPINGGAYNCLLNGTSKIIAAIAGVMTFLSYIATAVISAKVAVEYVNTVFEVPVIPMTILLLFAFACLVISGIKDSANVALGIFIFHIVSLTSFVALGLIHYLGGNSLIMENLQHTNVIVANKGGIMMALYLAFSASLLGVSGFESSANFVEEQDTGVFRKTLRNMLIGVAIFNPLIALVVVNSMPYETIVASKDFLLSNAAQVLGGDMYRYMIVADAFLVLSGAVLTSFVGVSGLLSRMAGDSCLPSFLNSINSKGSYPRIILLFFFLSSSILLATGGDLLSLAGVYTIAFLGVMSLFAFGNLILKETRTELKRTYSAPVVVVLLAFFATFLGILGNIRIDRQNLIFFELYFIPSILIVMSIIYMDYIMRFLLRTTRRFPRINKYIRDHFEDVTDGRFVVFVHHERRLYQALNYIDRNETGWNIQLVVCRSTEYKKRDHTYYQLKELLPKLQQAGAFAHFDIKLDYIDEDFGPEMIDKAAKKYKVRKNRMMIGSIHHTHPFDYSDLGGVRIIF
jgi:amino acid transporter